MGLQEAKIKLGRQTINYHYAFKAKSVPVVLIHGIGVSSRYMLPLAQELSKTHSVYAIDLPGFGKSNDLKVTLSLDNLAGVLKEFLAALDIVQPVLVGNSFGCQVSLRLVKNNPTIAGAMVLTGPTMNIYERHYVMQIARWLQNLKNEPTKRMAWVMVKDIWGCGVVRVHKTLRVGLQDRPEEGLNKLKTPILFMRGSLDPIAPVKWLAYLASQNAMFSIDQLAGAGHALNFNSPKPLAHIIQKYISSVVR